ncbi:MAG TPA: FKBP-type peptidyl-prolyl cis-trans isomerase [Acidobacteriaceae bacterium]
MITPTRLSVLSLLLTGAATLSAQTHAPVHHATTAHTATPHTTAATSPAACAKDAPVFSPKVPALPAGSPCFKTLYTITTIPQAKLENVSPMENPDLAKTFGLEPASFSLLYIDTKIGTGERAQPHKWYTVNYTGYLPDGTQFDSSVGKDPLSFAPEQRKVIPGWFTGFDGMHIGGKRRLYIPYELAYGPNGRPPTIPARTALIFDVEFVAQSDTQPAPKTPPAPKPAAEPAPGASSQPSAAPATSGTPVPHPPAPATPTPAPKR